MSIIIIKQNTQNYSTNRKRQKKKDLKMQAIAVRCQNNKTKYTFPPKKSN